MLSFSGSVTKSKWRPESKENHARLSVMQPEATCKHKTYVPPIVNQPTEDEALQFIVDHIRCTQEQAAHLLEVMRATSEVASHVSQGSGDRRSEIRGL
jgi:predicted DNA-binding protein (UPF0251 family)